MDKKIDTVTSGRTDLLKEIATLETPGNIRPVISEKNLMLLGTWVCAILITSLSSVNRYSLSTTLSYPNKHTQTAVVYEPQSENDNAFFDEEINNSVFVKTKPKKNYNVELEITSINKGRPVIDNENDSYET